MNNTRFLLIFLLSILTLPACRQSDSPQPDAAASEHAVTVTEPAAAVVTAGGTELEGMFRYLADAALFRDCRTNRSYPVAMEGAYIELERAYLNSGIKGGKEVYVHLVGRLLERPAMEGNKPEISLIVDSFNNLDPDKTCTPGALADLLNTYWKLTELNGEPIETAAGMKEAHLVLSEPAAQARGNAGCNNFFGRYEREENALSFGALGSTMMACTEGMETERAFLDALGQSTRYLIEGEILQLYAEDRLLARFEAVYL